MRIDWILLLAAAAPGLGSEVPVLVDFSTVIRTSRTVTTLQVVTNPILDRTFVAPNGTRFPNPIYDNVWASLKALQADLVRFVPWFPYPKKSVAELDAPTETKTSWNFSDILPQLEDFMDAVYGQNHTVVLNFATQPCWLFGDGNNKTQNCSYPDNPDESDFGYLRGDRKNLLDPSGKDLAAYYGRLLSYLVKGEFVDEHGVKHTGGPAYSRFNRKNGHVWELFNEAEHGYTVDQMYIHDYDVVVQEMIRAVGGPENAPAFMGIGAGGDGDSGLTWDFKKKAIEGRDASSFPEAKIDIDELGTMMHGDNDPNLPMDANLPDIYWNAAGAFYAYAFASLAPLGVEVLGFSQLAGSPKIPEWGIPLPQYPSVSLLDWRTGLGTAKYWVLKLLIEEFAPGDVLVSTKCQSEGAEETLSCMGAMSKGGSGHKLLIVNHLNQVQSVKLNGFPGAQTLRIVDPKSVQVASSNGIRNDTVPDSTFEVQPFGVVVVLSSQGYQGSPLLTFV